MVTSLIFDQPTGKLLDAEQTLIGAPEKLDVQTRAILADTTFLTSGYEANTTSRH